VLFALAACGGTPEPAAQAGDLVIREAWVRPAFVDGGNGAGYMRIENTGTTDDTLLSASAEFADMVQLHETTRMEGEAEDGTDDVMGMQQVGQIPIPAGETVALEVGGYHVMLMGIPERLEAGETVTLTLNFEQAGAVTVEADVREE
jgi:hypothetical protein